jgi:hypothetical protein
MAGFNKWIFGSLGFALTGTPIGAAIGFALGALMDNASGVVPAQPGGQRRTYTFNNTRSRNFRRSGNQFGGAHRRRDESRRQTVAR